MKIKVGQIRQDYKGFYVVTNIGNYLVDLFYSDGQTRIVPFEKMENLEKDSLIAEYKGWLNAINSNEFKNNVCNF